MIERGTIMAAGGRVDIGALVHGRSSRDDVSIPTDQVIPLMKLKALEESSIRAALARTGGKIYGQRGAAALLGAKPSTLASRMKVLGIHKNA